MCRGSYIAARPATDDHDEQEEGGGEAACHVLKRVCVHVSLFLSGDIPVVPGGFGIPAPAQVFLCEFRDRRVTAQAVRSPADSRVYCAAGSGAAVRERPRRPPRLRFSSGLWSRPVRVSG